MAIALDCITAEDTLAVISKLVSPEGTVGLLLPIKEGNTLTTSAEGKMGMELTDETNPFPKTVKVIGVKTFTYQTVGAFREVGSALADSIHLERVSQGESDAQDSACVAR